nr:polyribonucleotide nucleotidyltransferase [Tanacetum cinerariifolium]
MGSLSLTTTNVSNFKTLNPSCYINPHNNKKFVAFAANNNNNKVGNWDQFELKFGKFISKDSNFTLSKIKDRKVNLEYGKGKQPKKPLAKAPSTTNHSVPNVVLWNSTSFEEDVTPRFLIKNAQKAFYFLVGL